MNTNLLIAAASGALLFSAPAMAQVQQQRSDILGQLLSAVFGTSPQASEQVLESDWDQGRRPFEQRRETLETRIDAAVRDGSLSRREAEQIRVEYDEIVRLEAQYSADGSVSQQQRSDLRMRYRALAQRVGGQGSGEAYGQTGYRDGARWMPLASRGGEFEQRVTAGLRNRDLTQAEAIRLRADWRSLAQVEAGYQRGGIDSREQADLWSRYNAIDSRLGGRAGFGGDRNVGRWSQLETRLATAEQNRRITRNEAVQVRAQLSDLARLDAAYATGGYSAEQQSYLSRRYGELDQMLGYTGR
jgi:opacity protein-like surface antigen